MLHAGSAIHIVVQLIEMVTEEEIKTIATEQIDIGRQYIEVNSTTEKPVCITVHVNMKHYKNS